MSNVIKPLQKLHSFECGRNVQTQPIQIDIDENQLQKEAKMCLFELNKEVDLHYYPFHEKKINIKQCSLSQWQYSQQENTPQTTVKKQLKNKIKRRYSIANKDNLSQFEKSLIEPDIRHSYDRYRQNQTQMKKQKVKNLRINTEFIKDQNEIKQSLEDIKVHLGKAPKQSMNVKQMRLAKKKLTERIEQNVRNTQCETDRIPGRQWLPRIDKKHNYDHHHKNKYKQVFRPSNMMKYSVPLYSPLSRQLGQLHELISQQSRHLNRFFNK